MNDLVRDNKLEGRQELIQPCLWKNIGRTEDTVIGGPDA